LTLRGCHARAAAETIREGGPRPQPRPRPVPDYTQRACAGRRSEAVSADDSRHRSWPVARPYPGRICLRSSPHKCPIGPVPRTRFPSDPRPSNIRQCKPGIHADSNHTGLYSARLHITPPLATSHKVTCSVFHGAGPPHKPPDRSIPQYQIHCPPNRPYLEIRAGLSLAEARPQSWRRGKTTPSALLTREARRCVRNLRTVPHLLPNTREPCTLAAEWDPATRESSGTHPRRDPKYLPGAASCTPAFPLPHLRCSRTPTPVTSGADAGAAQLPRSRSLELSCGLPLALKSTRTAQPEPNG
jgi:hypothetical protein